MSSNYEYALFDFDGVIVDSEPFRLETYIELFRQAYGINVLIDPLTLVGRPESHNLKTLLETASLDYDDRTIERLKFLRKEILIRVAQEGFPIIESTQNIIERLRINGVPIGIVTNSSSDYLSTALNSILLDKNDFVTVTCDDVSLPKPSPLGYRKALDQLGGDSAAGVAFEDSLAGISAAKSAGLTTVGVLSTHDRITLNANFYVETRESSDHISKIISLFGN